MATTWRLTDDEQWASRASTEADATSVEDAELQAVCEDVHQREHRGRVSAAAAMVMDRHADALRRLGG